MSDDTAPDIHALLRTLAEQQTALLHAHAENVRLQRMLMEQLLGGVPAAASARPAPPPPTPTAPKPEPEPEPHAESASGDNAIQLTPAAVTTDRSMPRVAGGAGTRGGRYYQPAATQPSPTRRVSPGELDTLRRIQASGQTAQLVLTFGPHAGETLGQVAQSDPDYLRRLVLSARRPDVRAAAARLAGALPAPQQHDRRAR